MVFFNLSCLVNNHGLKYIFNFISDYFYTYFSGPFFCIKLNSCIHYYKCIVTCHTIYTISFILNNTAAHAIIHQNQTLIIEVGNCAGCGLVINPGQGIVQQTGQIQWMWLQWRCLPLIGCIPPRNVNHWNMARKLLVPESHLPTGV